MYHYGSDSLTKVDNLPFFKSANMLRYCLFISNVVSEDPVAILKSHGTYTGTCWTNVIIVL
jgi:hypothetical protein